MQNKATKIYESWGQLTVADYEMIVGIQAEHPDNAAKYIVEYLYDVDNADMLPIQEYGCYLAGLRKFIEAPVSKARLTPSASYTLHGRLYRVDITPTAFSVAQYTDLTNYVKGKGTLTDMLSVVLVPDGHDYNDGKYDMAQARKDIGALPLEAGFAVVNFFAKWSKASIKTFLRFLTRQLRKAPTGTVPKEKQERLEEEVQALLALMASCPSY